MTKSVDLLDINEVANYFGISESTVRRKVKKSRENGFGFILPLFSQGSKLLWRKEDVLSWTGENSETIVFNPSVPSIPATQMKSHVQAQRELRALGVKLPGDESNN